MSPRIQQIIVQIDRVVPSLLHLKVLASRNAIEICTENRLVHDSSVRHREVVLRDRIVDHIILVLLLRVEFVVPSRRIAEKLVLNNFLNAWTITLLLLVRMEHRMESFLLLMMLLLRHSSLVVVVLINWNAQAASHERRIAEWSLCDGPVNIGWHFQVIEDPF